jgi:hypothetical protein
MIAFVFGLWLACTNSAAPECNDALPCVNPTDICAADFTCKQFKCATSAQCPMDSHCDQGDCIKGCVEDGDCKTGYQCNTETASCDKIGCTDTNIDCGFKEFCNIGTGECYTAGGNYCKFCDEDYECGDGNYCYAHYCGVDCSGGKECPHGFECDGLTDSGGNIVAYQCITYCDLFANYDAGSFMKTGGTGGNPEACVEPKTPARMGP